MAITWHMKAAYRWEVVNRLNKLQVGTAVASSSQLFVPQKLIFYILYQLLNYFWQISLYFTIRYYLCQIANEMRIKHC
jgi:hypothetical protein